jgi:hypothetical protein
MWCITEPKYSFFLSFANKQDYMKLLDNADEKIQLSNQLYELVSKSLIWMVVSLCEFISFEQKDRQVSEKARSGATQIQIGIGSRPCGHNIEARKGHIGASEREQRFVQ